MLLGGEAGVGKSALLRHFGAFVHDRARVLVGACDPLSTPTALGPLLDVADALGASFAAALDNAASGKQVLDALRAALQASDRPTALVLEDVHWADGATLDLLRFLGRRMATVRALVVATYRDDEVGPRIRCASCSATWPRRGSAAGRPGAAVPGGGPHLASDADVDADELYRPTGGNPFFVTEVLAAGGRQVPPSVRDAVLARAGRLPPHGRAVLEVAAVIGGRIEAWLLGAVSASASDGLAACLAAGVLRAEGDVVSFRHELGRTAILESIVATRRTELHGQVLAALRSRPVAADNWARLAHHAEAAHDGAAVLMFAPVAAERAARLRAHREAAAQYARGCVSQTDSRPRNAPRCSKRSPTSCISPISRIPRCRLGGPRWISGARPRSG